MDKLLVYTLESALDTIIVYEENSMFVDRNIDPEPMYEFDVNPFENQYKNEVKEIDENSDCPAWVGERIRLGRFGEKIAEAYLMDNYSDVIDVTTNSKLGYDLEATCHETRIRIEVKTTTTNNKFHISINELSKAEQFAELYWIFFIRVSEKEREVKGYIIKNPVHTLSVPITELKKLFESEFAFYKPNNFTVELKDSMIERLESDVIPLIDYIESI